MNEAFPSTRAETPSKWRAYFELLRLPAVFTAIADVMMGYLVAQGSFQPPWAVALLIVASSLIYLAGMVLNDVHDADVDAIERPQRPLPSGRIPLESAKRLGAGLLVAGVIAAWFVGYLAGNLRPGVVASLLTTCVVLYDIVLKGTAIAPLLMGSCRFLNVLLGMSLAETIDTMLPRPWTAAEWTIAAGIGIYIVGVTIFARTEAQVTSRWRLAAGILAMFSGSMAALLTAALNPTNNATLTISDTLVRICIGAGLSVAEVSWCFFAIVRPDPAVIQFATRMVLRGLLMLDFVIAGFCSKGSAAPISILLLALPMWLLERWFKTT